MKDSKKGDMVTYKGKVYEVMTVGFDHLFLFAFYSIKRGDVIVSNVQNSELTSTLECV